jgi:hypothetical protein
MVCPVVVLCHLHRFLLVKKLQMLLTLMPPWKYWSRIRSKSSPVFMMILLAIVVFNLQLKRSVMPVIVGLRYVAML